MTHGKSVVVPVDAERVLDTAAAYLKQQYGASYGLDHPTDRQRILSSIQPAPAPSSLAGGEVNDNPLTFGMGALVVNTGKFGGDNAVFIARAKEPGEVGAYTGKSAFDRNVLQPGELVMIFPTAEQAQVVADALVGALTPRHEAPAEGAGDGMDAYTRHDTVEALRARSSAPEAREGLKPQVRPMEDTLSAFGVMKDHFVGASSRPVTHPAAPSADKLRIDLWWNAEYWEATFDNIEDAYEAATGGYCVGVARLGRATEHDAVWVAMIDIDTTGDGEADDREIRLFATEDEARQALAALQAEQKTARQVLANQGAEQ